MPLIAFTEDSKSLTAIEQVAHTVQERASTDDVAELELLVALFSARNLGTDTVLSLIRRLFVNTEILEESPLYHWLIERATEKVSQEAKAQGMAQGEERGLRDAVLTVLRGRFGDPTPDVAEAISAAERETLNTILLNATTDTLTEVRERLGLAATGEGQPEA